MDNLEQFDAALTKVTLGLCHSFMALREMRDWATCARRLSGCHADLCGALGETPESHDPGSMSRDGLQSTIVSNVTTAEAIRERMHALLDDPRTLPSDILVWVRGEGRDMLRLLASTVGSMLLTAGIASNLDHQREAALAAMN